MTTHQFLVLGVARARSTWFRAVAQWATSAALPVDFVKCVSVEEVRAHLATGRAYSALLLDAGLRNADRDLLHAARDAGCVALVVDDQPGSHWLTLGAVAVLPTTFTREQLVEVLSAHASAPQRTDVTTTAPAPIERGAPGRVIAVCGPGGTGASTVAIALAQEVARVDDGAVLLADLALRAEQALLHDARDVVPGLQELVDAHRGRAPTPHDVLGLTYDVPERGYRLLLGLRRARYWSALRPRAFQAAFDTLRATFTTVVCDITADFEGEAAGGSLDVEERNLMARTAVTQASVTVVVGTAGTKGIHSLARVVGELADLDVDATRIVPIVNLAPRSPKARAEITAALTAVIDTAGRVAHPTFLPRRQVEAAVRDGAPMPRPLGALVHGAVAAAGRRQRTQPTQNLGAPEPVTPGSLGSWSPEI